MKCLDHQDKCPQDVCECDKAMAICVRDVLAKEEKCNKKFDIGDILAKVQEVET